MSLKALFLLLTFFFVINNQAFPQTGKILATASSSEDKNAFPGSSAVPEKAISGDLIRISKENHVNTMSMNNKPCASVKDGTRLVFECWDALEGRSKEYFDNPDIKREPGYANPATGPIFIEGALPGNTLEIEIHDIRLSRYGFITLNKNQFIDGADRENSYIETEVVGQQMFYNGRKMPVQSMVGVIGTGDSRGLYTQEVGDNGGNMDTRIIKKGSKVLLPVYVEGALLAMGDVHAVMGDGEVFGQGPEFGAEIEVTVRVRQDLKIQRPMVINADRIACIASDPNVLIAKNQVVSDMGRYLVNVCGFSSIDASALIAFYGNLCFSQVVNPQKTVRMEIERKYIKLFNFKTLPY